MAVVEYTREYVEYLEAQVEALRAKVKILEEFRDAVLDASREHGIVLNEDNS